MQSALHATTHNSHSAPDGLGVMVEGIVWPAFEHGAVAFYDLQAELALWS